MTGKIRLSHLSLQNVVTKAILSSSLKMHAPTNWQHQRLTSFIFSAYSLYVLPLLLNLRRQKYHQVKIYKEKCSTLLSTDQEGMAPDIKL